MDAASGVVPLNGANPTAVVRRGSLPSTSNSVNHTVESPPQWRAVPPAADAPIGASRDRLIDAAARITIRARSACLR